MKAYYFIFIFLISGCSAFYIPAPKNVPLFENKGEVQIEAGASTNSIFATGSYAFSEKYAMAGNGSVAYSYIVDKPVRSTNELTIFLGGDVAHRSMELSIGRYNLLPSSERRLEVFAGTGYGVAHSLYSHENVNYLLGFVQVNTGKRRKYVETGWSLRTAFSGFQNEHGYYRGNEFVIDHNNYQAFHFEPLFVIRAGGQQLKMAFRSGLNYVFFLSPLNDGYLQIHLSIGLNYRF